MSTWFNTQMKWSISSVSMLFVKVGKEYNIFLNILPDTPRYEQCIKLNASLSYQTSRKNPLVYKGLTKDFYTGEWILHLVYIKSCLLKNSDNNLSFIFLF